MELMIVLIGGLLLVIPLLAIIALVRTEQLRRTAYEALEDHRDKIEFLSREIVGLRKELERAQAGGPIQPATAEAAHPPAATPVATPERAAAAEKVTPEPVIPAQPGSAVTPQPIRETPAPRPEPVFQVQDVAAPTAAAIPTIEPPIAQPAEVRSAAFHPTPPAPERTTPEPAVPIPAPVAPPAAPTQPAWAQAGGQSNYAYARSEAAREPQAEAGPPRKTFGEWLRTTLPLEEVLGMNLFAKIGIILLVLGFALLGRVALISMGPGARVALIYVVSGIMLGGGIWLENRERYRLVGRTGIGGGWALLFFTTYAMHHVAAMTVLSSNTIDCILMLAVAVAMVAHTLRYKSQLVTGLAFLLAFFTVALSQVSVYALAAGVILAVGIVAIALRMSWFELEVFGIVASYANHFYWLYKLYPDGVAGHRFPEFWPSAIILMLYWLVFRISYVVRKIRAPRDERISTIAALANTMLLGARSEEHTSELQ